MKPTTRKVLESGLVDRHVAKMLERWGTLEPGEADIAGRKQLTADGLCEFAEELDELLTREADTPRETRLEIPLSAPVAFTIVGRAPAHFLGCSDEFGHLIVASHIKLSRGDRIQEKFGDKRIYQVLEVEKFYKGDQVYTQQLTIE